MKQYCWLILKYIELQKHLTFTITENKNYRKLPYCGCIISLQTPVKRPIFPSTVPLEENSLRFEHENKLLFFNLLSFFSLSFLYISYLNLGPWVWFSTVNFKPYDEDMILWSETELNKDVWEKLNYKLDWAHVVQCLLLMEFQTNLFGCLLRSVFSWQNYKILSITICLQQEYRRAILLKSRNARHIFYCYFLKIWICLLVFYPLSSLKEGSFKKWTRIKNQ